MPYMLCETKWTCSIGVLGHLCAHIGWTGPGEPHDLDGEMNEMTCTLSSDTGFKIRALAVWVQARHLSVTEARHNIESLGVS